MSVFLPKYNFAAFLVPKVASSAVKRFFFAIENGRDYEPYVANGKELGIHRVYRSGPFHKISKQVRPDMRCIAIVRDPVKRLVSCYENKILQNKSDGTGRAHLIVQGGLDPNPEFDAFVDQLEAYRTASANIRNHSNPLVFYLGEQQAFFSKIYDLSQLSEFESDVKEMTGADASIPVVNKSYKKLPASALTDAVRTKIKNIYARDYDTFGTVAGWA